MLVQLYMLQYILNVPQYYNEYNEYDKMSWPDIASDIGIGKSFIDRFKRTFHPFVDQKHVISDISHIIFNNDMFKAVPLLKKYLKQHNLQHRWANSTPTKGIIELDEYIGNVIEKFVGISVDNEGINDEIATTNIDFNNLKCPPGYVLTPLSDYELKIKEKRKNGYINDEPTIYQVHIS